MSEQPAFEGQRPRDDDWKKYWAEAAFPPAPPAHLIPDAPPPTSSMGHSLIMYICLGGTSKTTYGRPSSLLLAQNLLGVGPADALGDFFGSELDSVAEPYR